MRRSLLLTLGLALSMAACKKTDKTTPDSPVDQQSQIVDNYANILEAGYQDSYTTALTLQAKINAFVANPTAQALTDAQNAWLAAREPYMQTEMGRFYGGPIDGDSGDGLLNSWPLDEGYVDYLAGDSHGYAAYSSPDFTTGIINMPAKFPTINESLLVTNNQPDGGTTNANGDNVEVSAGYHAIEFLLWGQDDTPAQNKIPGQRSYKDYLTTADATAPNGTRRAQYLQTVTQLLVENLKTMVDAWAPNANNYRKTFEANTSAAIANMFNGIGRLAKGEMAGERMGVPLALHAQEQEHSCFSDNTHRDLFLDMQGIANVYNGKYTSINGTLTSGPGLSAYVKSLNSADDTKMQTLLTNAQTSLQNIITNKPFDWLIDGSNPSGNQIVQKGVTDVSAVADWVSQIAHDLNLSQVNIPAEND
ncbi:putative iron-regulated protein [Pedobacter cryoconitis]|uniref:Putative iron-regulated protein n=1 Tax=Pedobacter cryoconitis TaxID=188932 RepID=A0A7W8ZQB6_9SPHI|nr:imelysin family protein [Pedobacter cryoconitis]MBB5637967.1 putative iron-regulated protein [Pedobacter cryoconitis]MBB6270911.1 putative iron-regulated protein [Pedobacter cryoconitis]